jgi:hypothetical protein
MEVVMRFVLKVALSCTAALFLILIAHRPAEAHTSCYTSNCATCTPGGGSGNISTFIPSSAFPPNAEGNTPIVFVDPNDGRGHRFIATQQGKIYVWNGWRILPTPFLDLSAKVLFGGERGLLAMAVAPDYETSGRFYVYYTADAPAAPGSDGSIVIERYTRSLDPEVANTTATTILVLTHPATNHNGGWLAFHPTDGYLYVSLGDGGGGCDSQGPNGQNLNELLGKVLRLDVSGADPTPEVECGNDDFAVTGYDTPDDNPFVGVSGCDEIWAYGVRNPFRFSFDRQTGDFFLGDVGQDNWEEINFKANSEEAPFNFGWVIREGCDSSAVAPSCCGGCVSASPSCQYPTGTGLYDPILCHSNPSGWASIMGGYRYRGTFVTALTGRYIYSDASCGQIWRTTSFDPDNPIAAEAECWDGGNGGTFGFGEDHLGELYVVSGFGTRIDCIHDGLGCDWATEPLVFGDDFETGNAGRWGLVSP